MACSAAGWCRGTELDVFNVMKSQDFCSGLAKNSKVRTGRAATLTFAVCHQWSDSPLDFSMPA